MSHRCASLSAMLQPVVLVRGSSDQQQAVGAVALTPTSLGSITGLAHSQQAIKIFRMNERISEQTESEYGEALQDTLAQRIHR